MLSESGQRRDVPRPSFAMKAWLTLIAAVVALILSVFTSLSGDRLGVERRVSVLEGQSTANQKTLEQIQNDVREIRQYLLGGKR